MVADIIVLSLDLISSGIVIASIDCNNINNLALPSYYLLLPK